MTPSANNNSFFFLILFFFPFLIYIRFGCVVALQQGPQVQCSLENMTVGMCVLFLVLPDIAVNRDDLSQDDLCCSFVFLFLQIPVTGFEKYLSTPNMLRFL